MYFNLNNFILWNSCNGFVASSLEWPTCRAQTDLTMLDLENKCCERKDFQDLFTDKIKRKILSKKILVEDIVIFDDEFVSIHRLPLKRYTYLRIWHFKWGWNKFKYWKGPNSTKCKRCQEQYNVKNQEDHAHNWCVTVLTFFTLNSKILWYQ